VCFCLVKIVYISDLENTTEYVFLSPLVSYFGSPIQPYISLFDFSFQLQSSLHHDMGNQLFSSGNTGSIGTIAVLARRSFGFVAAPARVAELPSPPTMIIF
jgi:hypothetical protein